MSSYDHIVEYSRSSRAKCHGQICGGSAIAEGQLRYGTVVQGDFAETVQWRHWGCVTTSILAQLAGVSPEQIRGFSNLRSSDQSKVRLAMARRRVDASDIKLANPSLPVAETSAGQKRPRAADEAPRPAATSSTKAAVDTMDDEEETAEPDEPLDVLVAIVRSQVVGVQYYDGLVGPGEEVRLIRQPLNQYDRWAIQVQNIGSRQVGHLPRAVAAQLSPLLDASLVVAEGHMFDGNLGSRRKIYTLEIMVKIYGSPLKRNILWPKLRGWATPTGGLLPPSGQTSSASVAPPLPPPPTAGPSKNAKPTAAQAEALRQAQEQQKANTLRATLDTMEKVDDERRRNGLLDQLLSAEDILQLPVCPAAPGKGKGLRVDLLKHQSQALQWALERENPTLPKRETDKPVQFWQLRAGGVYFNLAANTPQKTPPVLSRGAICADAMGLGKTLTMLALILATKKHASPSFSNSTLIVVPLSVLSNWEKQIGDHCVPGALSHYVYYGPKRDIGANELQRFDVVITTYQVIASEHAESPGHAKKKSKVQNTLFQIRWKRIILDEAHTIRNPKTKAARAACAFDAERRWCLAATPIINSPKDLGSLLTFLRICQPLDDEDMFKRLVLRKVKNGDPAGGTLLRNLMTISCLRRTKEMQDAQGNPLIPLPSVEMIRVQIALPPDAREFYDEIEELSRDRIADYMRSGNTMVQAHILSILTRMRQAVLHTGLVPRNYLEELRRGGKEPDNTPLQATVLTAQDKIQLQAKLGQAIEECTECAICFDEMTDPRITSCGHVFCLDCITLALSKAQQCPMDRRALSLGDLHAAEMTPELTQAPFRESSPDSEEGSSAKIDQLVQLLKLTPREDKALVFSQFTSFLDKISDRLEQEGITFVRFDGRMSAKRREETISQFSIPYDNDEEEVSAPTSTRKGKGKGKQKAKASSYSAPHTTNNIKVMLISLKAGALGLNLTVANHVFLMDPWWQEGIESQAIDRVNRIGQTKNVRVYQMIAENTVESKVLDIQERKKTMIKDAFSGSRQRETARQQREARLADLVDLFNLEATQAAR